MDRPPQDYAASMTFAQQQQQANLQQQQHPQYGFHPQPQQFPQQIHGQAFLPPHPSFQQQFPYPRPLQPQQQIHPHGPPLHHGHHLLHVQQQQQQLAPAFPPHIRPHIMAPFMHPVDQAPPPSPPPSDPELLKRIDKLVEYSLKNGPEFEAMIREKQQDNPAYSFLFGGEGHGYYRYKLWLSTRPPGPPYNAPFSSSSMPIMSSPSSQMMTPPPINLSPMNPGGVAPQMPQPPVPPFYDQHQHGQPLLPHPRPDYDPSTMNFRGLSGPLPVDVASELSGLLNNLNGTKESIKGAKVWFMQRSPFAPALAEALRDRVFAIDDAERQLHIVYLANDILFDSLQRRANPRDLDTEAVAFKPVLGSMLARIYHNPHNKEENQPRLQKMLQFWASKEVYDSDTIYGLEGEMLAGPPPPFSTHPIASNTVADLSGLRQQLMPSALSQDQQEKLVHSGSLHQPPAGEVAPAGQSFLPNQHAATLPPSAAAPFAAPQPGPASSQPITLLPASTPIIGEKPPPYPLFPPGLIPGMVRKMQIGSGVPYSALSLLDIPTIIPPSTIPDSDILDRVSKFFKEIGEINPSEGPMESSETITRDDEYEREPPVRKGGACIPPPPNLQVDPETGTLPDGSVERKPGSAGSGRLGLGATANPNEITQYDDVYSSYRKQRSSSYHTSMSARASAR